MLYQAFLTGSRVYGTPKPDSDIDIAVRVPQEALDALIAMKGHNSSYEYPDNDSASVKFGNLNLICITSDKMFGVWYEGTQELKAKAPVSRNDAIEYFSTKGVTKYFQSSIDSEEAKGDVKAKAATNEPPF